MHRLLAMNFGYAQMNRLHQACGNLNVDTQVRGTDLDRFGIPFKMDTVFKINISKQKNKYFMQ